MSHHFAGPVIKRRGAIIVLVLPHELSAILALPTPYVGVYTKPPAMERGQESFFPARLSAVDTSASRNDVFDAKGIGFSAEKN